MEEKTSMVANNMSFRTASEHLLAELASAAYEVALRHGIRGSFLEVELELWRELRAVLDRAAQARRLAGEIEPFEGHTRKAYCLAQAANEIF